MPSRSMFKAKGQAHSGAQRWWLSGGDEECSHCGQLYAYEAEYRCSDCDGPMCMHCTVVHDERHVCPDCTCAPTQARTKRAGR